VALLAFTVTPLHFVFLQDLVETLIGVLGMHPCEGTEVVAPNARSHTVLLAGELPGDSKALVRLSFGMDASNQVAMKVISRGQEESVSEAVHSIIENA
jgi:coatomer protein complex subunit gamma